MSVPPGIEYMILTSGLWASLKGCLKTGISGDVGFSKRHDLPWKGPFMPPTYYNDFFPNSHDALYLSLPTPAPTHHLTLSFPSLVFLFLQLHHLSTPASHPESVCLPQLIISICPPFNASHLALCPSSFILFPIKPCKLIPQVSYVLVSLPGYLFTVINPWLCISFYKNLSCPIPSRRNPFFP